MSGKSLAFLAAALLLPAAPAAAIDKAALQDVIVQCAACHGADGIAKDVEIPNLAGQHDAYIFNQLQNSNRGGGPTGKCAT